MKNSKSSPRRKFWKALFEMGERRKESRREQQIGRRFELLENRWMMHADDINGPHSANPPYDPNMAIPAGTEPIHLHANLSIYVNGAKVEIPAGIGNPDPIHTHDASGTIHIHPFTTPGHFINLGDVFDKWKVGTGTTAAPGPNANPNAILTETNLLGNVTDATHSIQLFVNGTKVESLRNYQIHDADDIVLAYSANPIVIVNTNLGKVPVELFADKTPGTVNNFLNYANDGDYNNSFFHRFVSGFVLQGGGFKTATTSFADPATMNGFTAVATDPQITNEFDNFARIGGVGATVTQGNAVIQLPAGSNLSQAIVGDRIRLGNRTDGASGSNMFSITAVNDAGDTVTVQTAPTAASATNVTWTIFPKVNVTGTLAMAKLGGNPNSATSQFFINLVDNDGNLDLQNGGFTVFGQILDRSILTDINALNQLSLFSSTLSGAQEVPSVTTSATGSGNLALNKRNNTFDLTLNVNGLAQNSLTASHIHPGATGVEGASFFDIGAGTTYTVNGTQLQRKVDNAAFPTAQINALNSSGTYLNVHTTANPDGEIRGQLTSFQGGLYSDLPTVASGANADQLVVIQSIGGEGFVKGNIFNDVDNDGVKDAGETGRQGFTIYADANNNGTFETTEESTTSDSSGNYSLRLPGGTHKIRLVPTTGFAKTLPADAYDVTVQIGRELTARDFGLFQVGTLTGVDLLDAADSGASTTDNITNFNNSSAAKALQFRVTGAVDGALVRVFSDGIVIGQQTVAAGSNGIVTMTTNGNTPLANGLRSIIATQEIGGVQGTPTNSLGVTIDNSAPTITSTAPTTANVGVALAYDVASNEEGQAGLTYSLTTPPAGVTLTSATNGTITWTPTVAQVGQHSFSITATDAAGNVATQPLTITVGKTPQIEFTYQITDTSGNAVNSVNVGGTFQLRTFVRDVRTAATGARGVFAAYHDVTWDSTLATANTVAYGPNYTNGQVLNSIGVGELNETGAFSGNTSGLGTDAQLLHTTTFTAANKSGNLIFSSNAPDASPAHDLLVYGISAKIPLDEIAFGSASVLITNPDGPKAVADIFNFDEDTANNPLNVLVNDTPTTVTISATGTTDKGGTVTIAADKKSLSYTPAANFFGEETFTYTITNGSDSAIGTVKVQVVDVNDRPPAVHDALTATEDSTANTLDVLKNDLEATNVDRTAPLEVLRISSVGATSNGGTVVIGSQGAFLTYTPAPNFQGTETFTYTVTDRVGTANNPLTNTATVTMTVTNLNDPPTAVADTFTANEDSTANEFNPIANDTFLPDPTETLTITSVGTGNRGGVVTITQNGTRVNYVPAANIFGEESFTYTISDGNGGSATGTVKVNLTNTNDPPDAKDDTTITVAKNTQGNVIDVLSNDASGIDTGATPAESFTISAVSAGSQGGTISIVESGKKVSYQPRADFIGTETFTYTMADQGNLTDTATVTVTVRDIKPSSIAGNVYVDADNDGVLDSGEQPIASVRITLAGTDDFGGTVSRETTTDATGAYRIANLAPGTYKLTEIQPTGNLGNLPIIDGKDTVGSAGSTASANDEFTVKLNEDVTATGYNFGEVTGFRIVGKATSKENSAGQVGSAAFGGLTVELFAADANNQPVGSVMKTTTTKADGSYTFDGVPPGNYVVRNTTPALLTSTGSNQQLVNLNSTDSAHTVLSQGARSPKFISYRDYMNSTARNGIFTVVNPGANGQQWSAFDSSWSGFTEAKVELSTDAKSVRIDVTNASGQKLFDQITLPDPRIRVLGTEGTRQFLRIGGGSTSYNLRAVPAGSGEGEAASSFIITTLDDDSMASTSSISADLPTLVQPGALDDGLNSLVFTTDTFRTSATVTDHHDDHDHDHDTVTTLLAPKHVDAAIASFVDDSEHAINDGFADLHHQPMEDESLLAVDALMEELA